MTNLNYFPKVYTKSKSLNGYRLIPIYYSADGIHKNDILLSRNRAQQQPWLCLTCWPLSGRLLPPAAPAAVGWVFIRALIWLAIVRKACSTLVDVLAEVSRNPIPRLSANSFPCSVETTRFPVKSDLLPTRSLLTFSAAYLSISCNHCFTLLKDS